MQTLGIIMIAVSVFSLLCGFPTFLIVSGITLLVWQINRTVSKKKRAEIQVCREVPVQRVFKEKTEQDIVLDAYALLLRRITNYLLALYPEARWMFLSPNALKGFREGRTLIIHLKNTGGYTRAKVLYQNMQFQCLEFVCHSLPERIETSEPEPEATAESVIPVDFSLMAFEWAQDRVELMNTLANSAISRSENEFYICCEELPDPDCWDEICQRLKEDFHEAVAEDKRIKVTIDG